MINTALDYKSGGFPLNPITLSNVNITYTDTLISDLSISINPGWTGISGPNGCGKTSLARYIKTSLTRQRSDGDEGNFSGQIIGPESVCYLSQLPRPGMEELMDFFYSGSNANLALASQMELKEEWIYRLNEISFGERRRLQIALALSQQPEVLILDEPENHLDSFSKNLTIRSLKTFTGIGIIIGHSRDIMNSLCQSTLLINQGRWHWYHVPLTEALTLYRESEAAIGRKRQQLQKQISRQKQTLQAYSNNAVKADNALSKKGISPKDRDKKGAIDLARLSGADKTASRKVALQKSVLSTSINNLDNLRNDKSIKLGLTVSGGKSHQKKLLALKGGVYEIFPGFRLTLPELTVNPDDCIVITGKNGSGKSSLLKFISVRLNNSLQWKGIPQELNEAEMTGLWHTFNTLNSRERGDVLAYFSRMASNPSQLIREMKASPGEAKKLYLAITFLTYSELLLLDEPANHLDIFSIDVLEESLGNYPGALLIVSHEKEFCRSRINKRWHIENGEVQEIDIKKLP